MANNSCLPPLLPFLDPDPLSHPPDLPRREREKKVCGHLGAVRFAVFFVQCAPDSAKAPLPSALRRRVCLAAEANNSRIESTPTTTSETRTPRSSIE